jgi:hypothetical protein
MFVDFFKYQSIKDAEDLKNKSKLTSVWSEMWQGGKLLREIPWDRMGEFSLKSYWIRYVFLYLEGTGVLPAMMGGGERGWKDNFDALLKTDFWLNVRKSINIVVRDPMITRGDYGGFIEKHKDGIEKRQEEMIAESTKNIEEEKKKARAEGRKPPDKKPLDRGSALEKAVDDELRDVVNTTKREWKKIVYDAALDWWKAKESPYKNKLKDVVERSGYWVS